MAEKLITKSASAGGVELLLGVLNQRRAGARQDKALMIEMAKMKNAANQAITDTKLRLMGMMQQAGQFKLDMADRADTLKLNRAKLKQREKEFAAADRYRNEEMYLKGNQMIAKGEAQVDELRRNVTDNSNKILAFTGKVSENKEELYRTVYGHDQTGDGTPLPTAGIRLSKLKSLYTELKRKSGKNSFPTEAEFASDYVNAFTNHVDLGLNPQDAADQAWYDTMAVGINRLPKEAFRGAKDKDSGLSGLQIAAQVWGSADVPNEVRGEARRRMDSVIHLKGNNPLELRFDGSDGRVQNYHDDLTRNFLGNGGQQHATFRNDMSGVISGLEEVNEGLVERGHNIGLRMDALTSRVNSMLELKLDPDGSKGLKLDGIIKDDAQLAAGNNGSGQAPPPPPEDPAGEGRTPASAPEVPDPFGNLGEQREPAELGFSVAPLLSAADKNIANNISEFGETEDGKLYIESFVAGPAPGSPGGVRRREFTKPAPMTYRSGPFGNSPASGSGEVKSAAYDRLARAVDYKKSQEAKTAANEAKKIHMEPINAAYSMPAYMKMPLVDNSPLPEDPVRDYGPPQGEPEKRTGPYNPPAATPGGPSAQGYAQIPTPKNNVKTSEWEDLFQLVHGGESKKDGWDAANNLGKPRPSGRQEVIPHTLDRPVTKMTVGELQNATAGEAGGGRKAFAVGRMQFTPKVFNEAVKKLNIDPARLFDEGTQREMEEYLIQKRPAVKKFIEGKGGLKAAVDAIAKEWRSVEYKDGLAFAEDDTSGVNNKKKAHISREEVIKVLMSIKRKRSIKDQAASLANSNNL